MSKQILWKDAWQAIPRSFGRFIAISLLMLLGTFAFIGLKITGPDMRQTALDFFKQNNLADVTVTSTYGLDQTDQQTIKDQVGVRQVTFGYYQDAAINHSQTSIRVYSNTKQISKYQLVSGKRPTKANEIALSTSLQGKYKLGQTINLGHTTELKNQKFKVVGFVKSSEYVSRTDYGQTNVGTGQLSGIAVTTKNAFNATNYNIARVTYRATKRMNAYSDRYNEYTDDKKTQLQTALNKLRAPKYQDYQSQITTAQNQVTQLEQAASANPALQTQLSQAQAQLTSTENNLKNLGYPSYTVSTRSSFPGYSVYRSNSRRVDVLANVFPVFLFIIAALVSLTTMMRFVEEERITIGTFSALGYSHRDISLKFILYSIMSSGIGVLLGAIGGFTILPQIVFKAYAASSTISGLQLHFSWTYLLIVIAVALCSTTLAALYALRKDYQEHPASLLLPKPPKAGSKILLERFTPLWRHLSFNYKVTFRNLFRYKSRALMTIFGVAGCVGLLVMGIGIRDSLSGIISKQYETIIKYDLIVAQKAAPIETESQSYQKLLNSDKVRRHQAIYTQQFNKIAGSDQSTQTITVIVPANQKHFNKFVNLLSPSGQELSLPKNGVILTQKMADLLKAKKGSQVSLKDANGQSHHFKVMGIAQMYMGHYLFMSRSAYEQSFKTNYQTNAQLVTLKHNSSKQVKKVAQSFIRTGAVTTTSLNLENQQLIANVINGLNTVIVVLIAIATILAMVVLYNLTNINVSERIRELSTIKVLGFFDREVTMYIYRETIILTTLGILFGYLFGYGLHAFIMINLPPDNAMFDDSMYPLNFLISTIIPCLITLGLAFIMHRKIRDVDMLEALKSVD